MFTLLPQLVDSITLKRRSHTCCLWRMWFILSVTQSRSSVCHVVTSSEEAKSSNTLTSHTLRWWTLSSPIMSNFNKMLRMDTNSNKQHQVQRFIYQVCVCLLQTSLTSRSHLSVVSQDRKRALWSGDQLHWSVCRRNNLPRRMPFFLLTVENDLTFNDFVLYNQTCDNLAADKT